MQGWLGPFQDGLEWQVSVRAWPESVLQRLVDCSASASVLWACRCPEPVDSGWLQVAEVCPRPEVATVLAWRGLQAAVTPGLSCVAGPDLDAPVASCWDRAEQEPL